jgi:hypothetical protein
MATEVERYEEVENDKFWRWKGTPIGPMSSSESALVNSIQKRSFLKTS